MNSGMKPWQKSQSKPDHADASELDPLLPQSSAADLEKSLQKPSSKEKSGGATGSLDPPQRQVSSGFGGALDRLREAFGTKFLIMISAAQHMVNGFTLFLEYQARPYLYKTFHVPAPQVQIYDGISQLAWALKPIIGVVSDLLPIGGKAKTPYMIITSIWGAAAYLYIGVVPHAHLTVIAVVVCVFLANFQGSAVDLLSEAKYTEKIQEHPKQGPDMLTFVWLGFQLSGVVALAIATASISYSAQFSYLLCMPPAALVIVPLARGYMDEKTLTEEDKAATRQKFLQQKEVLFLCFLMLASTVGISICGLVSSDPFINALVALVIFVLVLVSFSVLLSPTIAKFNAFSLLQTSLSISISGASFYFYTDTKEQFPEGPHFSTFFYSFVMGSGGAAMSVVGVVTYNKYLSTWSYRSLLLVANVMASTLSLVDIIMFTRFNVKMGIPDHLFVIGNGGIETMIYQWQWMPQVVILSYMCPKGMEATMYALLAGCHNLGQSLSNNFGALVLDLLDCHPAGKPNEGHQFDNFWVAALISAILPLAVVIFLFKLVPDRQQDENLLNNNSVTEGSLWNRLRGNGESRPREATADSTGASAATEPAPGYDSTGSTGST